VRPNDDIFCKLLEMICAAVAAGAFGDNSGFIGTHPGWNRALPGGAEPGEQLGLNEQSQPN
jgi:hypothetical protein